MWRCIFQPAGVKPLHYHVLLIPLIVEADSTEVVEPGPVNLDRGHRELPAAKSRHVFGPTPQFQVKPLAVVEDRPS